MEYKLLDGVNSPEDIKKIDKENIPELCSEIRSFLIDCCSRRGGHLASNLGTVELSVALHRVFDSPRDKIIFDVGHQAYTHKIITGRKERFSELRQPGGLSGFTSMRESCHDPFGAGHSSTALSAALGFAEANKLSGSTDYTIAVIGDGAYTGGMVHEAINNINPDLRLIIILNENGMSISKNRGAFASYLSRVRGSHGYRSWKSTTTAVLDKLSFIGKGIKALLGGIKNLIKRIIYRPNYFEELGFYYIGNIDGNDEAAVERALAEAKDISRCVIVHLKTVKGKGMVEAEKSPEAFHSVAGKTMAKDSFHSVFSDKLISLAETDEKIVAVTAAMGVGTGLNSFLQSYPKRCFDVGIAEEHALTFSAGLAASGYKPAVAIYSTFLQRGYDNILHDIALQSLPVRLLIDRAGLAVSDGATHHGIFDVAFLSHIPTVELYAPISYSSLESALDYAFSDIKNPVAIRYPNAPMIEYAEAILPYKSESLLYRCDFEPRSAPKNIIVTYGNLLDKVVLAKKILMEKGLEVGIVVIEKIKPYREACDFLLSIIGEGSHVLYAEEGIKNGGAGMITLEYLRQNERFCDVRYDILAIDDNFASPDSLTDLYDAVGLSENKIADKFLV